MKKYLFFATALLALASCTSEDYLGEAPSPTNSQGSGAIIFGSNLKTVTRGTAEDANKLGGEFIFAGTKGTGATSFVFDQYRAKFGASTANTTESNSSNWEYVSYTPGTGSGVSGVAQTIKYWDYSTTQYDFAAYSLGTGAGATPTFATPTAIAAGNKSFTLTGSADELAACYISDMVTAYNRNGVSDYGKVVQFKFRSLATKIRLAFYETVPGYSVQNLQFYDATTGGTASTAPILLASSAVLPSGSGTMTITYPTTGWENRTNADYNKAHVTFAQASEVAAASSVTFGALADFAAKDNKEADGSYLGRASNAATYAGGLVSGTGKYYTILPYETGANLTLRIKYTLVSTDGSGETINVDNATAVIPAELAKWKPNFAYTYIFKLSDMTNGTTGVDGDGNPVYGLTPITLDAVVVNGEDGVQETITTVKEPSITTYTKGKVVTENDEYTTGANIYVIVNNGTSNVVLTVGTNADLYTVEIQDGAAQTINEASIDNALANGTYDSTAKTYTVTDANGKDLVVTESSLLSAVTQIDAADSPTGNIITVAGAKFNPATAGTYVFRYVKTAPADAVYTAVANGTTLTSGETYYTSNTGTGEFVSDGTEVANGTNYFTLTTPAVAGEYAYKIIKVQ